MKKIGWALLIIGLVLLTINTVNSYTITYHYWEQQDKDSAAD